jgi:hypothetical protein
MSNLIDNAEYDNYNSDQDEEGLGGLDLDIPDLRNPDEVPLAHAIQNATNDLLLCQINDDTAVARPRNPRRQLEGSHAWKMVMVEGWL